MFVGAAFYATQTLKNQHVNDLFQLFFVSDTMFS